MVLLMSVLSLACVALPSPDTAFLTQSEPQARVPFGSGLAAIYRDACGAMVGDDDAASVQACVEDAVAMVLQDAQRGQYAQCDVLGGVLVSRIPPCATATLQVALLNEESSVAELLTAAAAAHRLCTAAVLCEGAEPESESEEGIEGPGTADDIERSDLSTAS